MKRAYNNVQKPLYIHDVYAGLSNEQMTPRWETPINAMKYSAQFGSEIVIMSPF
jgi:hypothetical protein